MAKVFSNTNEYDQKDLTNFLSQLSDKLKDQLNTSIQLAANEHAVVALVVGENQFKLYDTNQLNDSNEILTSEELAKKLDSSTFDNNIDYYNGNSSSGMNPLILNTTVFNSGNRSEEVNSALQSLYNNDAITQLKGQPPPQARRQFTFSSNSV